MRNPSPRAVLALKLSIILFLQPGSVTANSGPTNNIYESCSLQELTTMAKVWGFLKYFHPQFRAGDLDADAVLFDALEKVCRDSSVSLSEYFGAFNREDGIYRATISSVLDQYLTEGDAFDRLFDGHGISESTLNWIASDPELTSSIKRYLTRVLHYPRNEYSHYNLISEYSPKSDFKNENQYADRELATEYRLLSIFRLWNVIEYYSPHKGLVPKGWEHALEELIPVFVRSDDAIDYRKAVRKLLVRLEDGHAVIFNDEHNINQSIFGSRLAPLVVTYVDGDFIVKEVLGEGEEEYQIRIGDVIKSIDGKDVVEIKDFLSEYASASNDNYRNNRIAKYLTTTDLDQISIQLTRGGKELAYSIPTISSEDYFHKYIRWVTNNSGMEFHNGSTSYVHISNLNEWPPEDGLEAYENILFDLRGYPAINDARSIGRYFVEKGTAFARIRSPSPEQPGNFDVEVEVRTPFLKTGGFKGNLYILVNHDTMSQSEYIAMMLSFAKNSTVVGCQTAGADGDVVAIPLPHSISAYITGLDVLYPDGTPTQQHGVQIDEKVCDSRESVAAGEDAILNRALELIDDVSLMNQYLKGVGPT